MTTRNEDFTDNSGGIFYFGTRPTFTGGDAFVPNDPTTATPATPVVTAPAPTPVSASTDGFIAAVPVPQPTPISAPTNLPVPVVAGVPRFAATDYARAARALLPRGRAWPNDPASVQGQLLAGIGKALEHSDAAASGLLAGSKPGEITSTLPEWEASLGLPDPCAGANPTIAQRLNQVRGRFVGVGGQSRQHFIDFAAALGFTIAIVNYAPFRAGLSTVGNPVAGSEWSFVWGIRVLATTGSLPVAVLICELQAVKPAETTLILLA